MRITSTAGAMPGLRTLAAALFVCLACLAAPAAAGAATLGVVFDDTSPGAGTGTAPFDSDDTPGNDSSETNHVVRTNDIITYHWGINVNGGPSPDTTVTQTLPEGMVWEGLPGYCRANGTPPSAITDGGRTITCNLGDKAVGTAEDFYPRARVLGSTPNGTQLPTRITVSSSDPETQPVTSPVVEDVVSAAPRVNLVKDAAPPSLTHGFRNGVWGHYVTVPVALVVDTENGKDSRGNEMLAQPIDFTDELGLEPPDAELVQCGQGGFSSLPGGSGGGSNRVTDSGTLACTQDSPGGPIAMRITGADLSGNHVPSQNSNGTPVPANRAFLTVHYVRIWFPDTSIPADGGLEVEDTLTDFDPDSISGTSNFGNGSEPTEDNSASIVVNRSDPRPGTVSLNKWYGPPGNTGFRPWGPNQYVYPGQNVWATVNLTVGGDLPIEAGTVASCDLLDTSTYRLSLDAPVGPDPDQPAWIGDGSNTAMVVEYGTGGTRGHTDAEWFGDPGNRADDCSDDSSPTGWTTDPDSVPGGLAAITKVRVRYLNELSPGHNSSLRMNLVVLNRDGGSGPLLEQGTILANFAKYSATFDEADPTWAGTSYNPNNNSGSYGARLVLARAVVRVAKDTVPSGKVTAASGDQVKFQLDPTVTGYDTETATMRDVTVVDTLSAYTTYVAGSGSPAPTSVVENGDGTTTLTWDLGELPVNQDVPPITYDARVKLAVPNGADAVNTVVISSPDDVTDESYRTDRHTLTVSRVAGIIIAKTTSTPWVEPGDDLAFQVEYANNASTDLPSMQSIDVLPYDGDDRGTSFSGTLRLSSVEVHDGEAVYYTSRQPDQVSDNPLDPSNAMPGGSTQWCLESELGDPGCPAEVGDSTAVRVVHEGTVPVGVSHTYDLAFETEGNLSGDAYFNDAGLSGENVSLPAFSPPVVDRVVSSALGDYVWFDQNRNGVQDGGEPPAEGVEVRLTGTDKHGDPVDRTATTDAQGLYLFDDLISGEYEITFVRPGGYGFTQPGQGGDPALDSNADPATGSTGPITIDTPIPLQHDQEDLTWDAGLVKLGSITIIKDARPDDAAAFAFTAEGLDPGSFELSDDGQGDEDRRVFADLEPGTYSVSEAAADGWSLEGLTCEGSNGASADLASRRATIELGPGEDVTCTFVNEPVEPNQPPPPPPPPPGPIHDGGKPKPKPRIALKKDASVKKALPGDVVRYTILFRNARKGSVAKNVRICDTLPPHMTLVSTGGAKLEGGRICWRIERLAYSKRFKTRSFAMRIDTDTRPGTKLTNVVTSGPAKGAAVVRVKRPEKQGAIPERGGGVTG